MVAAFNVVFDFGGVDGTPGTSQVIDAIGPPNISLKTVDDASVDTTSPIPIVASTTKYSFWKHLYLKCTTAPSTKVDNLKVYSDGGGFGTGITTSIGLQFPVKNSGASTGYEVADGTVGDTGTELVAGHGGITSKADLFGYTSGAPLTGPTISEAGNLINAIDETSNYILIQNAVNGDTASPGVFGNETVTVQYDEI